jgi:hypothetical protein
MLLSLSCKRLAFALPRQEDHGVGACRITHGPCDSYFPNLVGKSIASIRRCLETVVSISDDAEAFVGGSVVAPEYKLRAGDSLEFLMR